MSTTTNLSALYQALQKDMISGCNISSVLNHVVDQGDNTEFNWVNWLNQYLPRRYKAAKATVIDCDGNSSDQIDIVIYDAQYSYMIINVNDIKYVPAESVYAVFEVKPEINKNYMEYAGKKAQSVRCLKRTSVPIPHAGGTFDPKEPFRIIAGILTTRSGWSPCFGTPLNDCLDGYNKDEQIDCGCVLSSGSFFYDYENKIMRKSTSEEALIFFFMQLVRELQKLGTVTAIDLSAYMKALNITEEQR